MKAKKFHVPDNIRQNIRPKDLAIGYLGDKHVVQDLENDELIDARAHFILTPTLYATKIENVVKIRNINGGGTRTIKIMKGSGIFVSKGNILYKADKPPVYVVMYPTTSKVILLEDIDTDLTIQSFYNNYIVFSKEEEEEKGEEERSYYIYDINIGKLKQIKKNIDTSVTCIFLYRQYILIRSFKSLEIINIETEETRVIDDISFDDIIINNDIILYYIIKRNIVRKEKLSSLSLTVRLIKNINLILLGLIIN